MYPMMPQQPAPARAPWPPALTMDPPNAAMVTVSADIEKILRALPSVDQLLQRPRIAERVNGSGHGLVVAEARLALDRMRTAIQKAPPPNADEAHLIDEAEQRVLRQLDALASPSLREETTR